MRTTGIEIENLTAIFVTIEEINTELKILPDYCLKITLENHKESKSISDFCKLITSTIDKINPDRIAIIERQTSGDYAAGALSFKVEGLIQIYPNKTVEIINSASIRAYIKKNLNNVTAKFKYQEKALNLCLFLMGKGK